jgi:hypothetical protein
VRWTTSGEKTVHGTAKGSSNKTKEFLILPSPRIFTLFFKKPTIAR